jgi:hypothetical protein
MARREIALSRFKWKPAPWMQPENIRAVWIYCDNGALSYEMELDPKVTLPANAIQHAPNSKNLNVPYIIRLTEPKLISAIEAKLPTLDVAGARGRGIIVGEVGISIGNSVKKVLVMSTLKDWRDWMENRRNFIRK